MAITRAYTFNSGATISGTKQNGSIASQIGDINYQDGHTWIAGPDESLGYVIATPNPKIINKHLVLHVDASKTSSYPGTGNVWYDISGNDYNLSMGTTASYNSDFGGVIQFAKDSNGYARNTSINLSNSNFTVIGWTRKLVDGGVDQGRVITSYGNNWLLGHYDSTYGDYYSSGWVYSGAGPSDTTWRMFTGTGNISDDLYSLYINDSHVVSSGGGSAGPNGIDPNGYNGQESSCQVGVLLCYDEVLSLAQIIDIYNTQKGRFGL